MPHPSRLLLPIATAALLLASPAHAEARRSAQSLPAPARTTAPIRFAVPVATPVRAGKGKPARLVSISGRQSGREDASRRGRGDRTPRERFADRFKHGRYDNRNYGKDRDRHDYEKGKDRAGHHFGHHGRDDSPGC